MKPNFYFRDDERLLLKMLHLRLYPLKPFKFLHIIIFLPKLFFADAAAAAATINQDKEEE